LDFLSFSDAVAHPAIVDTSITNSSQNIAYVVLHIQVNCIEGFQPESWIWHARCCIHHTAEKISYNPKVLQFL